jgi:hypothetical protein
MSDVGKTFAVIAFVIIISFFVIALSSSSGNKNTTSHSEIYILPTTISTRPTTTTTSTITTEDLGIYVGISARHVKMKFTASGETKTIEFLLDEISRTPQFITIIENGKTTHWITHNVPEVTTVFKEIIGTKTFTLNFEKGIVYSDTITMVDSSITIIYNVSFTATITLLDAIYKQYSVDGTTFTVNYLLFSPSLQKDECKNFPIFYLPKHFRTIVSDSTITLPNYPYGYFTVEIYYSGKKFMTYEYTYMDNTRSGIIEFGTDYHTFSITTSSTAVYMIFNETSWKITYPNVALIYIGTFTRCKSLFISSNKSTTIIIYPQNILMIMTNKSNGEYFTTRVTVLAPSEMPPENLFTTTISVVKNNEAEN